MACRKRGRLGLDHVIYIYVIHIFHLQICTNDYFYSNPFSAKGKNFVVSLIFSEKKYDINKSTHGLSLLMVSN